jgi:hypothetical protein
MGLFLAMSGVVGGDEASVVDLLGDFAKEYGGSIERADLATEDDGCLVISQGVAGVTVLYPGDFFDWEDAAQFLSQRLGSPVFSFHIHDGDLWMYMLYDQGEVVDQFNPVPDYWQELDDAERQAWQGNATEVARRIPGLSIEQISRYLVPWGDDVFDPAERKKAYPADQFYYGDDWQLVDFMRKLGFDYPVDDRGAPHGTTYEFNSESDEVM